MAVIADYHTHSNYSDGTFLRWMAEAAEKAGLEAIGFADHCMIMDRPRMREVRAVSGSNLDITYQRRRTAIEAIEDSLEITIYDAVEMDYQPNDENQIAEFLEEADFDYAVGSVHEVAGTNVHFADHLVGTPKSTRLEHVDAYFDDLESLIRSELFDIVAHPDIVERNEALRGLADESHYRQIAEALTASRTIPEINAGRIDKEYGKFHPKETFLEILLEYDIPLTIGSDSHSPEALQGRIPRLREAFDQLEIEPADPVAD